MCDAGPVVPDVLALYSGSPGRARARAWARWATTPVRAVGQRVPARGRVLEVGCGLGVICCHLALGSPERDVVGTDGDLDDIVQARLAARRAGSRAARCEFQLTPPGEVPEGPWDAVLLVDALARLDPAAQEGLVGSCALELALGGVLLVKEMGPRPRWKLPGPHGGPAPQQLEQWMEDAGLVVSREAVDSGFPQPHHLVTGARRRSVRSVPSRD